MDYLLETTSDSYVADIDGSEIPDGLRQAAKLAVAAVKVPDGAVLEVAVAVGDTETWALVRAAAVFRE